MNIELELEEFVELLQDWHANVIKQLKLVSESKSGTSIKLGDIDIDGKSDMARGIRVGVAIALDSFDLPFSVNKKD